MFTLKFIGDILCVRRYMAECAHGVGGSLVMSQGGDAS